MKRFTLKRSDKRQSTLKSLAPKKSKGSVKQKILTTTTTNDSDISR